MSQQEKSTGGLRPNTQISSVKLGAQQKNIFSKGQQEEGEIYRNAIKGHSSFSIVKIMKDKKLL